MSQIYQSRVCIETRMSMKINQIEHEKNHKHMRLIQYEINLPVTNGSRKDQNLLVADLSKSSKASWIGNGNSILLFTYISRALLRWDIITCYSPQDSQLMTYSDEKSIGHRKKNEKRSIYK